MVDSPTPEGFPDFWKILNVHFRLGFVRFLIEYVCNPRENVGPEEDTYLTLRTLRSRVVRSIREEQIIKSPKQAFTWMSHRRRCVACFLPTRVNHELFVPCQREFMQIPLSGLTRNGYLTPTESASFLLCILSFSLRGAGQLASKVCPEHFFFCVTELFLFSIIPIKIHVTER